MHFGVYEDSVLPILLGTTHIVSFAFNDPQLVFGEGPLGEDGISSIAVSTASVLVRNSHSAVSTGVHEFGRLVTTAVSDGELRYHSHNLLKPICNQEVSKLRCKSNAESLRLAIEAVLKPLKVPVVIQKQRGWSELHDIEFFKIPTLIDVDVETRPCVDHDAAFVQLLVAVEDSGSVLVMHLILHKDVRDVFEDARVEGHVLLFECLDSIEQGGIQNASV